MTTRSTSPLLLSLLICFLQVGCASRNQPPVAVPSYQWINPQQGIHLVNQRATSLETIFALGNLVTDLPATTDAQGRTIKAQQQSLKIMVIAMGKDHLRVRAWRKKKPVIDLTMNPEGMWVWSAESRSVLPLSHETLRLLPSVLRGNLPAGLRVVKDGSPWLSLTENISRQGKAVNYLMHKSTLTVRRYEFFDSQSHVAEAIHLENYELIDMYPWPSRVIASSDTGSMQIDFTDVQLDARPPQNAFEPPSKAVKLP